MSYNARHLEEMRDYYRMLYTARGRSIPDSGLDVLSGLASLLIQKGA